MCTQRAPYLSEQWWVLLPVVHPICWQFFFFHFFSFDKPLSLDGANKRMRPIHQCWRLSLLLLSLFFQKMSTYNIRMLTSVLVVMAVSMCDCRVNNLPTRCMPGLLEDAPPKVREACLTLSTIRTLSNAIETFIQDKQFPMPMPCE